MRSFGLTLLRGQLIVLAKGMAVAWQARLDENVESMHILGRYYSGHRQVTSTEFRSIVAAMIERHPEIDYVTWLPSQLEPAKRAGTMATKNSVGAAQTDAQVPPEAAQDDATPMPGSHTASPSAGEVAGFNLTDDDRAAMRGAAASGQATLAAATRASQPGSRYTCRIFTLVYAAPHAAPGRKPQVTGFLMGVVHLGRMTALAVKGLEPSDVELDFYEGQRPDVANLLFSYEVDPKRDMGIMALLGKLELPYDLKWGTSFTRAGRQWFFRCRPSSHTFTLRRMWLGRFVYVTSLLCIMLLVINLYIAVNRALKSEQLVIRRTKELQTEIAEREQAEARLLASTAQLQQSHFELERLNEMSELLQACHTVAEATGVIKVIAGDLFRDCSGAIYLRDGEQTFKSAAQWGGIATSEITVDDEACWALRSRKTHHFGAGRATLSCGHLTTAPAEYVCIPMQSQDRILGLLYLVAGADAEQNAAQQRFGHTVAEQLALALNKLEMQERLRELSIRDPLTQLFNRRYLEETLEREVSRAQRGQRALSVIMLDIDHFKHFNDTHSHSAGDTLLRALGHFLANNVRCEDIACRYGGEEFTLILPDASLAQAMARAAAMRAAAQTLDIEHQGQSLGRITLSLGIAAYPEHGDRAELLLRAADAALYRAKAAGRNRVETATTDDMLDVPIAPYPAPPATELRKIIEKEA